MSPYKTVSWELKEALPKDKFWYWQIGKKGYRIVEHDGTPVTEWHNTSEACLTEALQLDLGLNNG